MGLAYYYINKGKRDDNTLSFLADEKLLKKLAEKSAVGKDIWVFNNIDYYGMTYRPEGVSYQPLENYLTHVVSECINSKADSKPIPKKVMQAVSLSGELTTRFNDGTFTYNPTQFPSHIPFLSGIKDKEGKDIFLLCIHRDSILNDEYLMDHPVYCNYLHEIRTEMNPNQDHNEIDYFIYAICNTKFRGPFREYCDESFSTINFFDGEICKMVVNNNFVINQTNSILGDMDHIYEHIDRLPPDIRPSRISDSYINEVNNDCKDEKEQLSRRMREADVIKVIRKFRAKRFKEDLTEQEQNDFESKMNNIIKDSYERIKRNPRLAIPFPINKSGKDGIAQFVIPLYKKVLDYKPFAGLTIMCMIKLEGVNKLKEVAEKRSPELLRDIHLLDQLYSIIKFQNCYYSAATILPLPIVRMNVLPYVNCDISYLWCNDIAEREQEE